MKTILVSALILSAVPLRALELVTLDSPSPLVHIKVMVKAGSAQDPEGKEGLASLAGNLLIEGGFGDPAKPVTKDSLAEMTRPWGGAAYPGVSVSKEITTFSMTVPKEALGEYVKSVLEPMFERPLFAQAELDRVRAETLQRLRSALRFEEVEMLGLTALDNALHAGTGYAHPSIGTEKGLAGADVEALRRFYATYYRPENIVVGLSVADKEAGRLVAGAFDAAGSSGAKPFEPRAERSPVPLKGRDLLVVSLPNAIATGLHAGFPLSVTRKDAEYWPLYVANIWFGTHRDGFSHLYEVLRAERGYNYGDYSYIEHFEGRPYYLFPPTNHPRRRQDFSVWIRPVAHEYAAHVLRAMTWELENFVRSGLTEEQCSEAKNKAKVLYLSLAETTERSLGYRLDDAFYGLDKGYLQGYLGKVDGVSCAQVNAALRKHLQAGNLRYVAVTDDDAAQKLAEAAASQAAVWGKQPLDYQIDAREENGRKVYSIPEEKLGILRLDAVWANHPLGILKDDIRVVPAARMFETAEIPRT